LDIELRWLHHVDMGTTITPDDDLQVEAARRAERLTVSLGNMILDLARRGL
jgi:hypothetical protein